MKKIFERTINITKENGETKKALVGEYFENENNKKFYKIYLNHANRMLLWSRYGRLADKNNFEGHYNIGRVEDYTKYFIPDKANIFIVVNDEKKIYFLTNNILNNLIRTEIIKKYNSKYDDNSIHYFAPVELCKFYKKT